MGDPLIYQLLLALPSENILTILGRKEATSSSRLLTRHTVYATLANLGLWSSVVAEVVLTNGSTSGV